MNTTNSKAKAYCFTINNYTTDDERILQDYIGKMCTYGVYGREIAPSTGTKHIQGYLHYENARTWNRFKKIFPAAHIERARGTAEQNKGYCTKSGDVWEFGEVPKQGKRNDIDEVRELIKGGGGIRDVAEQAHSYQAFKFGERYLSLERRSEGNGKKVY